MAMKLLESLDRWLTKSHETELLRVELATRLVERKRERVLKDLCDTAAVKREGAEALQ